MDLQRRFRDAVPDGLATESGTGCRPFLQRTNVVLLGFAGLLLLMAVLALDSERQMQDVTLNSAHLRKEYSKRDALLDELRTNVFRAGTITRDYLLENEHAGANPRVELEAIRARNDALLSAYGNLMLPSEQESFETIRRTAESYLQGLLAGRPTNTAAGRDQRVEFVRNTVSPLRRELMGLVGQVNGLDQRDMDAEEDRIQDLQSRFQKRVRLISVAALVAGVVLAIVVSLRQSHLQLEVARRFEEVLSARRDLRLLSNRLVAAQEEERRKLSRELHDEVGQSMSAMLFDLGRLEGKISGMTQCSAILTSIRRLAEENVARVRDLSLLLRPSMLDELGLLPALDWHAREVERRSGLKVRMIADDLDDEHLPEAVRTCIYRVTQEALHNVVKHANASEAHVIINRDQDALIVSVQDNGIGFDPKQKGLGLLGIGERAASLGGNYCVESHSGAGTVLSVRLPFATSATKSCQEVVA
jgi:signal transduction histidine kinase